MSVWWRGKASTQAEIYESARLADDRGLLLGDGLFETLLVVGEAAPLLDRHLARMKASAAALRLPLPESLEETVVSALPQLVRCEGSPERGSLRVTVTRGFAYVRGLAPTDGPPTLVLSYAKSLHATPGAPARAGTAVVVNAPRIDPLDPLGPHKTLSRMSRVEARRRALLEDADYALMPTIDGDIAEADAANVFVVLDGVVVTPPLDRGILPGITRARCLDAMSAAGMSFVERPIRPSEVLRASEAFLTSSLDVVRPLGAIDGRQIVAPGSVAIALARALEPSAA